MKYIYWADLPLRAESSRTSTFYNPNYQDALQKDLTNKLHEELKVVALSKMNIILSWFGPQGFGKSYSMLDLSMDMAKYKGIQLNINNVSFNITYMLNALQNINKGDIAILDEQLSTAGLGSSIEKMALNNIEMTVRAHKLNLFFSAPQFIGHRFHYFFEVWQLGNTKGQIDFNIPIEKQWEYTKLIIYNWKEQMMGYVITKTPENKKFLEEYEKKKDVFIEEVRLQQTTKRHETLMDFANTILEDSETFEKFALCKTKRLRALLIRVALKGKIMSIEELNTLVDYMSYLIEFESELKTKYLNILDKHGLIKKKREKVDILPSLKY